MTEQVRATLRLRRLFALKCPEFSITLRTLKKVFIARRVQRLTSRGQTHEGIARQAADSSGIGVGVREEAINLIVILAAAILGHRQHERRAGASLTSSMPSALRIFCFAREKIVSIATTVRC